jgi:noranthrone synthase
VKVILPAAHHQSAATTTAPVENPTEVFTLDIPTTILAAKSVGKTTSTSGKKSNVVLKVISEESGIALEELTDDSNFIDIGIDSLSSMVIGSRLREDLGLDLDTEFSLFVDCPTVRALKNFLGDLPESTFDGSQEGATISQPVVIVTPEAEEPASVLEASVSIPIHSTQSDHISEPLTSPTKPVITEDTETATAALKIIAEESGVAVEDLTRETVFADIGINSLSSLVISSRFREELNLDLDSAFSLFDDVPSVYKLEEFLGGMSIGVSENSSESPEPEGGLTPNTEPEDDADAPVRNLQSYCRPTTSVILQGLPKVAQKILFMLPDGGGSASSYIPIPRLKSDIAIVGLNCPYARDPENMNCTHTAMIESFCNEIRRRQPEGPYHLGGWSSGGAFAYVTAEALINQGEEVHSLIIIDAPVPQVMEKLPVKFYEHCNSVGLFANQPGGNSDGTSPPPSFLIPHFVTVVDVMLDYKVSALKTNHMPRVGIVWATDTVMDEKTAPKMKGMHFMVQKRKDFGPDGWDTVLPGAEFDIVRAEGANHFTLMVRLPSLIQPLLRVITDLCE